jgi:hypothetical protein
MRTGRNEPCPCGSGRKYKHCCLPADERAGREEKAPVSGFRRGWAQPEIAQWPIVRAVAPVEAVWRATGLGSAGIFRRRPDGRLAWVLFKLDLCARGIDMAMGKPDDEATDIDALLADLRDVIPPFADAPAELSARYIWGAWAFAEAEGMGFPPAEIGPWLRAVPTPTGGEEEWLADFEEELTPAPLFEITDSLQGIAVPNEREVAVPTQVRLHASAPVAVADALRASHPDRKGYRFIPATPPVQKGVPCFELARPLPRGPRSGMPARGDLQIQGFVLVDGEHIEALAATLSMAARLMDRLRETLGCEVELETVRWETQTPKEQFTWQRAG